MPKIGPRELLAAYANGIFPMAESADSKEVFWVNPEWRGIIPLDAFHIPRRLKRTVRQDIYTVRINQRFADVMRMCGEATADRKETWINAEIFKLYGELHKMGHAHSVEAYRDDELVGGLYGVTLHRAFFGESMFSRARDASKVALCHLVAHLKIKGFTLLDTQFLTEHLAQFGAIEISRADYLIRLVESSLGSGSFGSVPNSLSGVEVLQSISQTS